jgi:hypothetical protein
MYLRNIGNINSMKTKKLKRRRQNGGARGITIKSLLDSISSISPARMFTRRLARVLPDEQDEPDVTTKEDKARNRSERSINRKSRAQAKTQAKKDKAAAEREEQERAAAAKEAAVVVKEAAVAAKKVSRANRPRNPDVVAVLARIDDQAAKTSQALRATLKANTEMQAKSAELAAQSAEVAEQIKSVTKDVHKISSIMKQPSRKIKKTPVPEMTDEEMNEELKRIETELALKGGKKSRTRRRHKKSRKY